MIEYIEDAITLDGSEGLLAIVVKGDIGEHIPRTETARFLTDKSSPLQLGLLHYVKGESVAPHTHILRKRTIERTQEVLIVKKGCIDVRIYNSSREVIRTVNMVEGDLIILLGGGHSLRCIRDAEIVEIKSGDYLGRDSDKVDMPM